jgi:hypothetical protein
MNNFQDIQKFQESITEELTVIKNRVRNIIGDAHWGEDGRYKEAVLTKVLKNYIPNNVSVGTGFIVSSASIFKIGDIDVSNQIDILLYDNTIPVVFREGDFVIVTHDAVKAIVEVKSKLNASTLGKAISKFDKLKSINPLISSSPSIFKGIFSYELDGDINSDNIAPSLIKSDGFVNHISVGSDLFVRYWNDTKNLYPQMEADGRCYNFYKLRTLSFSYFISNLLHFVSTQDPIARYNFSFPIPETKERFRYDTVWVEKKTLI